MTDTAPDPRLDPGVATALARQATFEFPPRDLDDIPKARIQMRRENEVWQKRAPELAEIHDDIVDVGPRAAKIRIYRPQSGLKGPVLLYLHGGGWCLGDLATHDALMRRLAIASEFVVVGLDYALAPELPFPAAFDETLATVQALRGLKGERLGLDTAKLALGGDSAGANLALAAAIALGKAKTPVDGLVLFYGAYTCELDSASYREFGNGAFGLSLAEMKRFLDHYAPDASQRRDPRIAPLYTDLTGLPPTYLMAAGLDCLRDDTLALATRLGQAGVRIRLDVLPGTVHGFLRFAEVVPAARRAINTAGAHLKKL